MSVGILGSERLESLGMWSVRSAGADLFCADMMDYRLVRKKKRQKDLRASQILFGSIAATSVYFRANSSMQ